jgi:hypothetical protein
MHSRPAVQSPRRKTPEADLQRLIVAFLRLVLPAGAIVHHSANEIGLGGQSGRARQAILSGMGVCPGFSDLIVLSEGRVLFLELKSKAGRLSQAQERFRDLVQAQGFAWAMVRSIDEVLDALGAFGFRFKAAKLT